MPQSAGSATELAAFVCWAHGAPELPKHGQSSMSVGPVTAWGLLGSLGGSVKNVGFSRRRLVVEGDSRDPPTDSRCSVR